MNIEEPIGMRDKKPASIAEKVGPKNLKKSEKKLPTLGLSGHRQQN
jgi:hypothetical protein